MTFNTVSQNTLQAFVNENKKYFHYRYPIDNQDLQCKWHIPLIGTYNQAIGVMALRQVKNLDIPEIVL